MMTFLSWFEGVSGPGAAAMPPAPGTQLSLLAFELPSFITPALAGLTVGAVVGVVGFIAVLLIVGRSNRRPRTARALIAADQVVFIPPYAPRAYAAPAPAFVPRFVPFDPSFVPSSDLSARVFAKMRYDADAEDYREQPEQRAQHRENVVEVRMLREGTPMMGVAAATVAPVPVAPVTVTPVVVLSAPTPAGGIASDPHPLGIISATSSAMRAAPIADLSFDDGPTEIGETYFDEPPQPRRRSDPPRIRPIVPAGPRFPERTDRP